MRVCTHLTFNGECEAAFRYYERCLGGKTGMLMRYRDSPMAEQVPPEWRERIIHANLSVEGGDFLAGADAFPGEYKAPQGFYVLLEIEDEAEAERVFQALSENGRVEMALQETFWARRFGVVVDRYGVPWEVNCGRAEGQP
jgi:PhnB protein